MCARQGGPVRIARRTSTTARLLRWPFKTAVATATLEMVGVLAAAVVGKVIAAGVAGIMYRTGGVVEVIDWTVIVAPDSEASKGEC